MIDSVMRITLNLQETNTLVCVKAKRGDTGRKLLIHLSDGSIPYPIAQDCYAVFTARKSDGSKIHNPCAIENQVIEYTFTEQTCASPGTMHCELKLYGGDRKLLTSACFLINVLDTVYREGDEVTSEGEMTTLDQLICDASVLIRKLRNDNFRDGSHTGLNDRKKESNFAMISFIDDDCREEVFTRLWPVIQEKQIPYTLACSPGDIGRVTPDYRFLTDTELLKMYRAGVDISCHHYNQKNMDTFPTEADYRQDLLACQEAFAKLGIQDVHTLCYPQGVVTDDYLKTVKTFHRMGFTIDRGINHIPYETYHMKRCEVFPSHGLWGLEDAREYVNRLEREGGWLIFMTHAWYDTFDPDALSELIDYITGKEIPIVDIQTAVEATGNIIEIGRFRKPMEEMHEPFFVMDASGAVWANAVNTVPMSQVKTEVLNVKYYVNTYMKPGGGLSDSTDVKRTVTENIPVAPGEIYRITGSAIWGGAIYAILDETKTVRDVRADSTNTKEGEILENQEVVMPEYARYLRVSCNLERQPDGFQIRKITPVI